MDGLLELPLDRFRRALPQMSSGALAALGARLDVQQKRHRLARGEFGIGRHRAPLALELLARRETAWRAERERRLSAVPAPIQLAFPNREGVQLDSEFPERRAA